MPKHNKNLIDIEEFLRHFIGEILEKANQGSHYFVFTQEELLGEIVQRAASIGISLQCGPVLIVGGQYLIFPPDSSKSPDHIVFDLFYDLYNRFFEENPSLFWVNEIGDEVLVVGGPV